MKYIAYENLDGNERFVIFDEITTHSDMAKYIRKKYVIGAGFVGFGEDGAHCYGESISMNIKSRGEKDSQLIQRLNEQW